MEFTNENFKAFRNDLKEAVEELEKKYNVSIHPGNISYDSDSFTLKLAVHKVVEGESHEETQFKKYCHSRGLKESDFGKTFTGQDHKKYKIVAINPKAKKNFCIIENDNGKRFSCHPVFLGIFEHSRIENIVKSSN